jgi:hypothetical protein
LVELALSILLKEKTEEAITGIDIPYFFFWRGDRDGLFICSAHSALANLDPFALKQAYSAIAGFLLEVFFFYAM